MDLAGLGPATPILKGWYSTNWVTNPNESFNEFSFSPPLYLPYSNGENHSLLIVRVRFELTLYAFWVRHLCQLGYQTIINCSPNCQSSTQFLELNFIFTRVNLLISFSLVNPLFCKTFFTLRRIFSLKVSPSDSFNFDRLNISNYFQLVNPWFSKTFFTFSKVF